MNRLLFYGLFALVIILLLYGFDYDRRLSIMLNRIQYFSKTVNQSNKNAGTEEREIELHKAADEYDKKHIRNYDWEQVSHVLFLKRTAAYYFHDREKIYLYGLGKWLPDTEKNSNAYKLKLIVKHDKKKYELSFDKKNNNVSLHTVFSYWSHYEVHLIAIENFNIIKELREKHNLHFDNDTWVDENKFQIKAFVQDLDRNLSTHYPLTIQIKNANPKKNKQGSILCSGVLYHESTRVNETNEDMILKNSRRYEELLWWIENNKQMGYKKVVLCNNSIPNTADFNQLFDKYKDFVEVYNLHYIPNFINGEVSSNDHKNDYLRNMSQLDYRPDDPPTYVRSVDIIKVLFYNECFNRNIDTQQHIGIVGKKPRLVN